MLEHLAPTTTSPCAVCGPALLGYLQQSPQAAQRWEALPQLQLRRGAGLLRVGELPAALWFVEQGLMAASFLDAQGRERIHAFYPELQWLGQLEPSLPSPLTLQALEDCRLRVLPHQVLQRWQAEEPQLGELLWQGLNCQVQRLVAREQQWLMLDASSRYQRFMREEPALAQRLRQVQIASYLGITDVALSRIRRRLRQPKA